jgi:prevent-host-death family protein
MRLASVAEVRDRFSSYLARARKMKEPVLVTRHGRPYALIQPVSERDLEGLDWHRLAEQRLRQAWEGEDDTLYDYL